MQEHFRIRPLLLRLISCCPAAALSEEKPLALKADLKLFTLV
jgi:hypothetical protein